MIRRRRLGRFLRAGAGGAVPRPEATPNVARHHLVCRLDGRGQLSPAPRMPQACGPKAPVAGSGGSDALLVVARGRSRIHRHRPRPAAEDGLDLAGRPGAILGGPVSLVQPVFQHQAVAGGVARTGTPVAGGVGSARRPAVGPPLPWARSNFYAGVSPRPGFFDKISLPFSTVTPWNGSLLMSRLPSRSA